MTMTTLIHRGMKITAHQKTIKTSLQTPPAANNVVFWSGPGRRPMWATVGWNPEPSCSTQVGVDGRSVHVFCCNPVKLL